MLRQECQFSTGVIVPMRTTEEFYPALINTDKVENRFDERSLACPIGADQGEGITGFQTQGQTIQHSGSAPVSYLYILNI